MWANLGKTSAIGLVSGYLIWLFTSGGLNVYIHPRYHSFTLIMAVLAAGFTLSDLCWQLWHYDRKRTHITQSRSLGRPRLLSIITIAIILLGISLPPPSLSLQSTEQRAAQMDAAPPTETSDCTAPETSGTGQTLLYRWLTAARSCHDPQLLIGTPLVMIGFITKHPTDANSFYLTRFVVSCCAVDATPLHVRLISPKWQERYAIGQWVRVQGEAAQHPDGSLVVQGQLQPIEPPKAPYEFLGALE